MLRQLTIRFEPRFGLADAGATNTEADSDSDADQNSALTAEEDPTELDPLSNFNTSKRLREMASLLNRIADGLTGPQT